MSRETKKQPYTLEMIRAEIASLKNGSDPNWGKKSRLLLEVERTSYWENHTSSFSRWIVENLDLFKVKRASLWRYLASGHYYLQLQLEFKELADRPLEELSSDIGPEKLELLEKISRVAPKETFRTLATRLLEGHITRPELISAWETFRPALEGKTARGRGVLTPKVDESSSMFREASFASAFINCPPTWTGIKDIEINRTFMDVYDKTQLRQTRFDVVVVVKGQNSPLVFHGIEIMSPLTPLTSRNIRNMQGKFNYMWLALDYEPDHEVIKHLPVNIGVLMVSNNGITIIRQAELDLNADTGGIAQQLLERALS